MPDQLQQPWPIHLSVIYACTHTLKHTQAGLPHKTWMVKLKHTNILSCKETPWLHLHLYDLLHAGGAESRGWTPAHTNRIWKQIQCLESCLPYWAIHVCFYLYFNPVLSSAFIFQHQKYIVFFARSCTGTDMVLLSFLCVCVRLNDIISWPFQWGCFTSFGLRMIACWDYPLKAVF